MDTHFEQDSFFFLFFPCNGVISFLGGTIVIKDLCKTNHPSQKFGMCSPNMCVGWLGWLEIMVIFDNNLYLHSTIEIKIKELLCYPLLSRGIYVLNKKSISYLEKIWVFGILINSSLQSK